MILTSVHRVYVVELEEEVEEVMMRVMMVMSDYLVYVFSPFSLIH